MFLAVKATQIEAAADWLATLVGPQTVVRVLQNGIEQAEIVRSHLPRGDIVPAVVWFPAQALQGTRCAVDLAENFSALAWRKLLQNAVAGLMALTHRRSGIFSRSDIAGLTLAYARECLAVARAEGAELGDEVPQEILEKFQAAPADMSTSILTDWEAGRPLEWDIRTA